MRVAGICMCDEEEETACRVEGPAAITISGPPATSATLSNTAVTLPAVAAVAISWLRLHAAGRAGPQQPEAADEDERLEDRAQHVAEADRLDLVRAGTHHVADGPGEDVDGDDVGVEHRAGAQHGPRWR